MTDYDSRQDTFDHIRDVQELLLLASTDLLERGINHDDSKLHDPEKSLFDEYTPKLKDCTYGSDEYTRCLSELKVALDHHYQNNSHHPEHYENGISGMTLLDLLEMFCDWWAATKRHDDGDIRESIEINAKRFGIDDQLKQILINTMHSFYWLKQEDY